MTAHTFLDAACVLWVERDDEYEEDAPCAPGDPGSTWRDWMVDFLATAHAMGEGFDGKRPNCGPGWQSHLESALRTHDTSFPEVLVAAFGMDTDGRPRPVLRPFGSQSNAFRILISMLEGMETEGYFNDDESLVLPNQDMSLVMDVLHRALYKDTIYRPSGAHSTAMADVRLPVGTIATVRQCAMAHMNALGGRRTLDGEVWSRLVDYLDAVMLRRHPTSSFLGMPLRW